MPGEAREAMPGEAREAMPGRLGALREAAAPLRRAAPASCMPPPVQASELATSLGGGARPPKEGLSSAFGRSG